MNNFYQVRLIQSHCLFQHQKIHIVSLKPLESENKMIARHFYYIFHFLILFQSLVVPSSACVRWFSATCWNGFYSSFISAEWWIQSTHTRNWHLWYFRTGFRARHKTWLKHYSGIDGQLWSYHRGMRVNVWIWKRSGREFENIFVFFFLVLTSHQFLGELRHWEKGLATNRWTGRFMRFDVQGQQLSLGHQNH